MARAGLTMGPSAGPRNGADEKITIPKPRSSAGNKLVTVPPEFVRGLAPAVPARKRKMMRVHIFWLAQTAPLKMVKSVKVRM